MLHQTLPFFFHFSPSSSSSSLSSPALLSQIELEMECVAAKAFKTKFWPETMTTTPSKPNLHSLGFEDFWVDSASNVGNVSNGVDEFLVDEFLDFSEDEQDSLEHKQEQEDRDCASVSSQEQNPNSAQDFSQKPHLSTEFDVPTYDKADLEWLSHFVDDSFSEFDSAAPPPQLPCSNRPEPASELEKPLTFPATQVPARPRTKRSRTGSRVWPNATAVTASPTVTTAAAAASTTTTTTPSSSSASSSPSSSTSCLIFAPPRLEFVGGIAVEAAAAAKRRRRILAAESGRRCSHCGVQKTPQWRAGPRGAKTLCNACGVRFKSGRLLPEYRPACSPTFSSEVHSNSHRKVLEMRRMKEAAPPASEVVPEVQSF